MESKDGRPSERKAVKPAPGRRRRKKRAGGGQRAAGMQANRSRRLGRHRRRRRRRRILLVAAVSLPALLLAAVCGYFVLKAQGKRTLQRNAQSDRPVMLTDEEQQDGLKEGEVLFDGKKYRYKEDIISILCMGVDTKGTLSEEDRTVKGQADAVFLLVLDPEESSMRILGISRDTMTDVEVHDAFGGYAGTEKLQLALQYAYGDGKAESCELMAGAVSNLLYGLPIHGYCAVNLDAISVLNDAVGGVEVTIREDLTKIHPDFQEGRTLTLDGEQAFAYVKRRSVKESGSSYARMERQKEYMLSFIKSAKAAVKENLSLPVELFGQLSGHMVTNIGVSEVAYLADLCLGAAFDREGIRLLPGEIRQGETYEEFYIDEEALRETLIEVFYEEVLLPQGNNI